jgi:ABC-type transport system substrate-binding protein
MRQAQGWKSIVLRLAVLLLLTLGLGRAEAQAPAVAGKAKVDRLVMGLILPYRDYWRPWINGTPDHMIQHDPAFEWLFEVSPEGQYKPWLAESWEMAQDGRSWRLKLQKGVQFQHGYGEFTAKDVVHNHALWCDDHYPGRQDPPFSGYRNGMCMVQRIEVINNHEIKPGQDILSTSAEIPDCIPHRGRELTLRWLQKFEEPQLLYGQGPLHRISRRLRAIHDQGFVRC